MCVCGWGLQGGVKGAITARSRRITPAGERITGGAPAPSLLLGIRGRGEKKKKTKFRIPQFRILLKDLLKMVDIPMF